MLGISRPVRAAVLYGYPELAQALGLNPVRQLRSAGLTLEDLRDPEGLIPVERVRQLLERSARDSGAEDFGLHLAAGRRLANLGPISIVLREEPTGLAALQTFVRYLHLVNASVLTRIDVEDTHVFIREDLLLDATLPMRQSVEMAVGVMFRILRELLGPAWAPVTVCFTHRAPADLTGHRRVLGRLVDFDAAFNGIVCRRSDLERELPGTDAAMASYARSALDKALVALQPTSCADTVRRWIAAYLPMGKCSAGQIARQMGVDRRTLHRWLAGEGQSYSGLLAQTRRELAARLLRDGNQPIREVAHLLGFSGGAAFAHWSRKHLPQSASGWRKLKRQGDLV
ncbi:MAG: HTH-type transcriptional regulator VirS [Pseudomonadota bacterium]|jgi:AraC-like DNA-binding protein